MMTVATPLFRLQLLGDLAIYHRDGTRIGEARRKPLAVLAYLAAEAPRAVNRELLAALLWPDSSPEKARRTLAQTLYALRRELGAEVVQGVSQLTLDTNLVASDLAAFREAVVRGEASAANAHYGGPFLDGMYVAGASEFEQWAERWRAHVESQRDRLGMVNIPAVAPVLTTGASREAPARRRWWPPLPFAWRAALLAVLIAGSAAAVGVTGGLRSREPETALEVALRAMRTLQAERRAQIDSANIGRILLLPPVVMDAHPTATVLGTNLGRTLRSHLHGLYTSLVPAREAERIRRDVLHETERWPHTSDQQIARMMARTGAALAIAPVVRWRDDSLSVAFTFHRSIAHTSLAAQGSANLETLMARASADHNTRAMVVEDSAQRLLRRFVRSLETCEAADHREHGDAPWCWGKGRQLVVPAGAVERAVALMRRQRRS